MKSTHYKKLYRSRHHRMIAGVCSGLAEHFNIDPTWIRLLFIFLFFLGGCALAVYIIMWLIIPLEPIHSGGKTYKHEDVK